MAARDAAIELMRLRLTMLRQEAEAMEGGDVDMLVYLIGLAELEAVDVVNRKREKLRLEPQ